MLVTILVIAGAWDEAPTGWRILPATSYSNDYSWFVRELEVYASPDCTGAPIPPFQTFGTNSVDTGKIVDGDPETAWSSMTYGKTFDAREHYVGFTVRKANAVQGNCVKLNQGSLHGGGSGIAKEIMLQERVDNVWFDVITFRDTAESAEWHAPVSFSARPPRPPYPPGPPPTPNRPPSPPQPFPASKPATAPAAAQSTSDQGLSVGAIAGIAVGGAVGLALVLGLCGVSVYICRKMDRGLKDAKHGAKQDPRNSKPTIALAKPKPGKQDVEMPPC
jgi:hypothetical protein